MNRKMSILMGVAGVLAITAGGCKKKEVAVQDQAAVQNQAAAKKQTTPGGENIPQGKFTPVIPAGLPNIAAFPGGIGDVELINDQPTKGEIKINKKDKLSMTGWAANNNNGSVPSKVILQLNLNNKAYYASASKTKKKRGDIAKITKTPAFADSAWQLDADISSLPSGKYLIGMILSDGTYIVGFDTNKYLVVK